MKKISQDEFNSLPLKNNSKRKSPVTQELQVMAGSMNVDEAIVVTKEEWTRKSTPSSALSAMFNGHKTFSCLTLANESGWVIKRVR